MGIIMKKTVQGMQTSNAFIAHIVKWLAQRTGCLLQEIIISQGALDIQNAEAIIVAIAEL